nr:hypothetical protein [uncultured Methanospirillum sp.]
MMVWNKYYTRAMILLSLLSVCLIMPVSAYNGYLDGGFLGIPSDIYSRMDPSVTNNIIGTVQEKTLFGLSDDKPLQTGYWKRPSYNLWQRNRYSIFNPFWFQPTFFF